MFHLPETGVLESKTVKQKPVNKPQAEFFMVFDSDSGWVSALISFGDKLWSGSVIQVNFFLFYVYFSDNILSQQQTEAITVFP